MCAATRCRQHELVNRGVGATGSSIFAACWRRWVDEGADLVILEFSINDAQDAPFTSPERRAYEQLVRALLRLPGRPALLQLHHHRWWHPVPGSRALSGGVFYEPPLEAQLGVLRRCAGGGRGSGGWGGGGGGWGGAGGKSTRRFQ